MKSTRFIFLIYFFSICIDIAAQNDIPLGTWRAHLSFNKTTNVVVTSDNVYAASSMGVMVFDRSDNSITTFNKLNGLSSSGVSAIAFDHTTATLIIGYSDGNLDIIRNSVVSNFSTLKNAGNITGSRRINNIAASNGTAFLATDYGIVVFDLKAKQVTETWRDLGKEGERLVIAKVLVTTDSVIAATSNGVIMGSRNDNLLDFHNWSHFNSGDLNSSIEAIAIINNKIFAGIDNKGLYAKEGDKFVSLGLLTAADFRSLAPATNGLLITTATGLWILNSDNEFSQIQGEETTNPYEGVEDETGIIWIADGENGLVSNNNGTFSHFLPNGPSFQDVQRLRFADGKLYAIKGGFTTSGTPAATTGNLDYFENGLWKQKETNVGNVSDVAMGSSSFFTASFGDGLAREANNTSVIFNASNSPLKSSDITANSTYISRILPSSRGLWIANYGVAEPIHLLSDDNTWQSFSPSAVSASYVFDFIEDYSGSLWLAINPQQGGGLIFFDPETGETTLRNNVVGTGGLLNNSVRSLAIDRDGYVWVGTNGGLGYFYSQDADAVIPIFEDRFLLKDEKITAIEVDGGNRKWIGTENGVWLFDPTGEKLIYNFNENNSPLFSNVIRDIEINPISGEVFFATSRGIISFRSDATTPENEFNSVKIFPNPVSSNFTGSVGITGLTTDAEIRITDVSGKLIWRGKANGGTAAWNVRGYNGQRARSGIYLVFAATADGSDHFVGKIAVIE